MYVCMYVCMYEYLTHVYDGEVQHRAPRRHGAILLALVVYVLAHLLCCMYVCMYVSILILYVECMYVCIYAYRSGDEFFLDVSGLQLGICQHRDQLLVVQKVS